MTAGNDSGNGHGGNGAPDGGGGPDDEDLLIEQVAGAYRPVSHDELRYHPAWHDLGPDARERAFERARALRALEAALDPDGLSTTARAVLDRITGRR
ncbi:MAG TPA: hypothetical protein VHT91_02005 [Kofleriaceae bacterium]|jgi:hypothetical protein|nr:hypothetical protein [Kofleriaceae bacterium]